MWTTLWEQTISILNTDDCKKEKKQQLIIARLSLKTKQNCAKYITFVVTGATPHVLGGKKKVLVLPVSVSLSWRRIPMECLSDGSHAVRQSVQATSVKPQTSVSHVAAKHKHITHRAIKKQN